MAKEVKQLTPRKSLEKVKKLLKEKRKLNETDFMPGNLLFYRYNAKDKTQTYDKTPLVLILRRGRTHTLALNFNWVPYRMRLNLIKHILFKNERNIRNNKPLQFDYQDLKPMLKGLGYAPLIRLYINKRISSSGVVLPPERMLEAARLRAETFTGGISAETIYKKINRAPRATRRRPRCTSGRP